MNLISAIQSLQSILFLSKEENTHPLFHYFELNAKPRICFDHLDLPSSAASLLWESCNQSNVRYNLLKIRDFAINMF